MNVDLTESLGSELALRPWEGDSRLSSENSARTSSHNVIQPELTSCGSVLRLQFLGGLIDGTWSLAYSP